MRPASDSSRRRTTGKDSPTTGRWRGKVDFYGTSFYPKHSAFVDRDVAWRGGAARLHAIVRLRRGPQRLLGRRTAGRLRHHRGERQSHGDARGPQRLDVDGAVARRQGHQLLRLVSDELRLRVWRLRAQSSSTAPSRNAQRWPARSRESWTGTRSLFLDARPPRAEVAVVYNPLAHFVGGRQRDAAYGGPQGEVVGHRARFAARRTSRAVCPQTSRSTTCTSIISRRPMLRPYKLVYLPLPADAAGGCGAGADAITSAAAARWSPRRGLAGTTNAGTRRIAFPGSGCGR